MQSFAEALKAYTHDHPFNSGSGDSETVLDQLYQAYSESHESDSPEISEGFKELECFLESLPLSDNNDVATIIDELEKNGAQGVILGCTEIGLLIQQKDVKLPVFDTTLIHATKAALLAIK